jgi:hypothetical protein
MSIFKAIADLITMVKNMTKKRNENKKGSSDSNYSVPEGDGDGNETKTKDKKTCPKDSSTSSSSVAMQDQPQKDDDDGDGDGDGSNIIGIDVDDVLPPMNLNSGEEDDDGPNEPGKSFLEMLFSFVLDPLAAIIKGIIQTVKLVIVTINVATNLKRCAKWFFIYVFCTLVYLPISILFSLLNLSNLEKKIWKILNSIDAFIFCLTEKLRGPGKGFHLVKFNDDIREICFLETVVPTNCSAPAQKKSSKKKKSLSELLSSQLFLIVTVFFMCFFIYYYGRYGIKNVDGQIVSDTLLSNSIPFSFLLLLILVVCVTLFLLVSIFTSAFIYIFIVSIIPLSLFLFSFIFYTFSLFYEDDNTIVKKFNLLDPSTWKPTLDYLAYFYVGMIGLFYQLPIIYKYIVGCISIFVIFIIIMIIIFLSLPVEYVNYIQPVNFFFSFLNISEGLKKVSYKINSAMNRIPETTNQKK